MHAAQTAHRVNHSPTRFYLKNIFSVNQYQLRLIHILCFRENLLNDAEKKLMIVNRCGRRSG